MLSRATILRAALLAAAVATAAFSLATRGPGQHAGGGWIEQGKLLANNVLFPGSWFGWSVAGPGDLDLDGYADLLAGEPLGSDNRGVAYALSLRHETFRRIWKRDNGWDWTWGRSLGAAVDGAGDLNGDAIPDVVIGAPGEDFDGDGVLTAVHGRTGMILWRITSPRGNALGYSVSGAGDVNRDGRADVLAGAPVQFGVAGEAGAAFVYSGANGLLLYSFEGPNHLSRFGHAVDGGGDADADGYPDFVIGAPGAQPPGSPGGGAVYVYSGRDGSLIHFIAGPPNAGIGRAVAYAGDLDGDGHDDLIAGAPYSAAGAGTVFVYSGRSGGLLFQIDAVPAAAAFGRSVDSLEDSDFDGVRDLAVGMESAAGDDTGMVSVFSGAGGAELVTLRNDYITFGWDVADAGDVDRNGFSDLVIGAPSAGPPGFSGDGGVFVYGFEPFLFLDATELSASSGTPVRAFLDFSAGEGGRRYALLASASGTGPTWAGGIEIPLTRDPLLDLMLGGWSPPLIPEAFGTLQGNGQAEVAILSHPALASWIGRSLYVAAVSYEPATLSGRMSSIARSLTIVP